MRSNILLLLLLPLHATGYLFIPPFPSPASSATALSSKRSRDKIMQAIEDAGVGDSGVAIGTAKNEGKTATTMKKDTQPATISWGETSDTPLGKMDQVQTLTTKMNEVNSEKESLQNNVNQLYTSLAERDEEIKALRGISGLAGGVDSGRVVELEESVADMNFQLMTLKKSVQDKDEKIEGLEQTLFEADRDYEINLKEQLDGKKAEMDDIRSENSALARGMEELRNSQMDTVNELRNENLLLKDELEQLKDQMGAKEGLVAAAEEKGRDLLKQLAQMEVDDDLARRKLASELVAVKKITVGYKEELGEMQLEMERLRPLLKRVGGVVWGKVKRIVGR